VSPATTRRDLAALQTRGELQRVHGGAVVTEGTTDEPLFDDKTAIAAHEKEGIAAAARRLVPPHGTLYLDGGSTVLALARLLTGLTQLTVVTNSLRVAHLLSAGGPHLILIGGALRRLSQTFVGPLTRHMLEPMHFDVAFMGTIGLSAANGLTTTDPDEAFTKECAMARADRTVLLADSSKFARTSLARFASASQLNTLITDRGAPAAEVKALKKAGVEVIHA
jgi:DeoR/GlpR family transcriptional regulator of sugar metabolism